MEIESDSFIMFCIRPTDFGNKLVADISHRKYYPRDNTLGRKLPRGLPVCIIIRSRYGEYSNMEKYTVTCLFWLTTSVANYEVAL